VNTLLAPGRGILRAAFDEDNAHWQKRIDGGISIRTRTSHIDAQ
jgi:hypothetical protein